MVWAVHGSIHSPHLYGVGCPRLNPQPTSLWCGLSTAQSTAHIFTVWAVHGSIHSPHLIGVGCPRLNPQPTSLRCGLPMAQSTAHILAVWAVHGHVSCSFFICLNHPMFRHTLYTSSIDLTNLPIPASPSGHEGWLNVGPMYKTLAPH